MNKKGKRLLCGRDVRAHRRFCGGRFDHRVEVRSHESQANSTRLPMRNKIFRPHGRVAGWGEALRVESTVPPISFAIPYEVRTARFVAYRSPAPTHIRIECLMNGRSGSQKSPQHGIPPAILGLAFVDNVGAKPPPSAKSLPVKQVVFRNIVSKNSGVIL